MSQSPSSPSEFSRGHVFKRRLNTVRRDAFHAIKDLLLKEIITSVNNGSQECILNSRDLDAVCEHSRLQPNISWRDVLNDKNVGENWRGKYNILMTAANHGNGDIFLRFEFYEEGKPGNYKKLNACEFEQLLRLGWCNGDEITDSDDDSDEAESYEEPLRDKKKRRVDEEDKKEDDVEEESIEEDQPVHLCDVCGEAVTNGASQAHSACVKLL
jgi:hypothetical protein